MKAFVDSDVLIWHLRGKSEARKCLQVLIETEGLDLWIGAMQRAEIVFFMREGEEKATSDLLGLFKTDPIDQAVVDLGGRLYRKWNPSHGVDPNDALLAAAVALRGGKIVTLNTSHYPMSDIVVERAWPSDPH